MKCFSLAALMALSLAWIWPLSAAQAESVILENGTGRPISAVYLAPAGTQNWTGWGGDDRHLEPGRKWRIEAQASTPAAGLRDLRVIFDDGQERTYFGLDLNLYAYALLGETEAELFEWDPSGQPPK